MAKKKPEESNQSEDIIIPEIVIDGDELTNINNVEQIIISTKSKNSQKIKSGSGGPREKVPPEVLGAVIGAYLSGKFASSQDIAKELNVSETFVSTTVNAIPKDYVPVRDENINQRVAEKTLEFLESGLDALANISRITENTEWMLTQSADKLAVFYGVKADKIMKIMELIERANSSDDE